MVVGRGKLEGEVPDKDPKERARIHWNRQRNRVGGEEGSVCFCEEQSRERLNWVWNIKWELVWEGWEQAGILAVSGGDYER